MKNKIDHRIAELSDRLNGVIDDLHQLTAHVQNDELKETLSQLSKRLEFPFTFVIVGEVKAGKSSFINALLESEKEICKVAPSPMTDTIQQIVYGDEEAVETLSPFLKRISQPIDILREIAIVDTPGTNTIVEHHQEITENFIPYSDLIVFVFEAKNPYRQSAWAFFDFVNEEWRRKIIFVLQQKDLLPEADLAVNVDGVLDHARKKGIDHPVVFAVSAKMEQEGQQTESGFAEVRSYIASHITGGKAPFLKLENSLATAEQIEATLSRGIDLRQQQYHLDTTFRNDIKELLDNQVTKTKNQIAQLVENLLATYDKITAGKEKELHAGLSLFTVLKKSISSVFSSEAGINEWLTNQSKDFENQLNASLRDKLQTGILDVADNIQLMGKLVDAHIKTSKTVLTDSDEIFADIAERRANVLRDLQQSFQQFMNKSENFYDQSLLEESSKMAPNLATGGGIAVVGVIITALVNGAVFDITGGILTTIGIFFASISIGLNRRKIINRFREEIQKGHRKLEEEVTDTLQTYTERIRNRIDDNFIHLDRHLLSEAETLAEMEATQKSVKDEMSAVKSTLNGLLSSL